MDGKWLLGGAVVVVLIVLFWGIKVYNQLVRLRNLKEEGWSGVDVQLKRRHDLVGNLVASVKGAMEHERGVLEAVTRYRAMSQSAAGVANTAKAEGELSMALGRLFAVMENYPNIRANQNIMSLQSELANLEGAIETARRYYNATARNLNIVIESFPSLIIAGIFKFSKAEFFEIVLEQERQAPVVSLSDGPTQSSSMPTSGSDNTSAGL